MYFCIRSVWDISVCFALYLMQLNGKLKINKQKKLFKKMKKIVKAVYEAPVVELFEARVEKGFAGSGSVVDLELEPVTPDGEEIINGDDSDSFMGK